jgi:TetR/AcrR family transcriptional regulator, regulator of cefoperazone and chloramphenicol sensitivity
MTQRSKNRTKSAPRREEAEQGTRQRLLEVAGQVFAEKGFDRATGKEICERAGTNTAAVNYYFEGIDGLYAAVIREARNRLMTTEAVLAAVAGKADARSKLEAILELFARAVTGTAVTSWAPRVFFREIVAPSPAFDELEQESLIRVRIMRGIVSELTGLPEDHPAVARGCVSVIGACFPLLLFDRGMFKRMFPSLSLTPQDAPALARHLAKFALAGLAAVARDARLGSGGESLR